MAVHCQQQNGAQSVTMSVLFTCRYSIHRFSHGVSCQLLLQINCQEWRQTGPPRRAGNHGLPHISLKIKLQCGVLGESLGRTKRKVPDWNQKASHRRTQPPRGPASQCERWHHRTPPCDFQAKYYSTNILKALSMFRKYSTSSSFFVLFFFSFSNRLNPLSTEFILSVLWFLINTFKNHVQNSYGAACRGCTSWPGLFRLLKTHENTVVINTYNLNTDLCQYRCTVNKQSHFAFRQCFCILYKCYLWYLLYNLQCLHVKNKTHRP